MPLNNTAKKKSPGKAPRNTVQLHTPNGLRSRKTAPVPVVNNKPSVAARKRTGRPAQVVEENTTQYFDPEEAKEAARNRSLRDIKDKAISEEESVQAIKTKHKKAPKKKKKLFGNIAKTAQDTIPFHAAYENGIIEAEPGYYTKSYYLEDVNFRVANREDQESIFAKYEGFINSFDQNTKIEITINNRNIDEKTLEDELLCEYRNDGSDNLRDELNDLILMRMHEGKNNLVSDKILTVGLAAEDIKAADVAFRSRVDKAVQDQMRLMLGRQTASTPPMNIEERVKCLHDIYNIGHENELPEGYDLLSYIKQGIGVKDILAPSSFRFKEDYFTFGDSYGRVMYCKTLPTKLSTDFIAELSDMPFNLTASIHFEPLEKSNAINIIKRHLVTINGNVVEAQKRATKAGYGVNLISQELRDAQQQGEYLMEDVRLNNQGLFFLTIVIAHYADSLEKLKEDSKMLTSLGARYSCGIAKLSHQQEIGFTTALPLSMNKLYVKRLATTEAAALFIPFNSQEILQPDGVFYGVNALSRNLIVLDRAAKTSKNPNALILGQPGSGKSVTAKTEILNILLTKDEDSQVFIIDPEAEYVKMAEELKDMGSAVVKIKPGSGIYLNPLDMDVRYGEDDTTSSPIAMKSDYICSICEIAMGGRNALTPHQRSLIDRCVRQLYIPYLNHMESLGPGANLDVQASPTLDMLYEMLYLSEDREGRELASALEMYAKGSFDCFARTTNVDIDKRLVVYDIRDVGGQSKELALQVCLNHIWNCVIENGSGVKINGQTHKRRTYIYIDEAHLVTRSEAASAFLMSIWKRARKWNGFPTAITQNLEDMLTNESSRAIINNCEFVTMLGQSKVDRKGLQNLFGISDAQLTYITNSPPGQGLIYNGQTLIPFENKIPEDTELFRILTTKPA